jgi:homopolymeric O-antigen transport system permease protein
MSCLWLLLRNRHLIWSLTALDFKIRYAGSRFGIFWMFLGPLMILGSYLFVFGGVLKLGHAPDLAGADYGFVVACGLLPWIGFSEGIMGGTSSVLAHRNLMKGQLFPMELVPVTAVCSGLLGQLCGTALLVMALGFRGVLGQSVILLPVFIILQALFTVGIVWFLSCINILYRDLSQVVRLLIVLLMFISPIAYTGNMVPASLEFAIKLNPLAYIIEGYRDALLFNHAPSAWEIGAFSLVTLLLLQTGYHYFMRLRKVLPDLV